MRDSDSATRLDLHRMGKPPSTSSYRDVEMPGQPVTIDTFRTVVLRYVTAGETARGRRILELGCGPGLGLEYLRECGASRVVGADRNPVLLELARTCSSPGAPVVRCDAARLPFAERTFEMVLLLEVLMYLADPVAVLREVRRILAPGGSVLLTMPNPEAMAVRSPGSAVHFYSHGQVRQLLLQAGFAAELFGAFPFEPGAKERVGSRRTAGRVLDGLERCGFPHGLRMRLTGAVLGKNQRLPVRIDATHCGLLPEGDGAEAALFGAPDECRVLYAWGRTVRES